eukprot:6178774-Pleurochrysis_carterae.AAC.2
MQAGSHARDRMAADALSNKGNAAAQVGTYDMREGYRSCVVAAATLRACGCVVCLRLSIPTRPLSCSYRRICSSM